MQQRGFSLVELMVAMALGLVISGGAISMMFTSRENTQTVKTLSQVQQSANVAFEIIGKEVRKMGYGFGCPSDTPTANSIYYRANNNTPYIWDIGDGLKGFEVAGDTYNRANSNELPNYLTTDALAADSDLISIQTLNQDESFIVQQHQPKSATIELAAAEHPYENGDILGMVDRNCEQIGIFAVSVDNSNGANGASKSKVIHNTGVIKDFDYQNCKKGLGGEYTCENEEDALNREYPPGSGIFRASHHILAIMPDEVDEHLNTLVRINGSDGSIDKLVLGIDTMQLTYGMGSGRASNGFDRIQAYYTAAQIDADASLQWENVIAVSVAIGVASQDTLNGEHLTKEFNQLITIRNRVVRK